LNMISLKFSIRGPQTIKIGVEEEGQFIVGDGAKQGQSATNQRCALRAGLSPRPFLSLLAP
jgi:hypothetical protein